MNPRGSDGKEWVDTLTWILADYDYVRVGTKKAKTGVLRDGVKVLRQFVTLD